MRTPTLPPVALAGLPALVAVVVLLGGCGDDVTSSDPPAPPKAMCGGGAVATAQMRCPPGFTPPAS
ncbi:hypothetical protein DID96_28450 [Burkholderia sp. Bp8963]|uniref:hypothetical protein n=1 Tax=Burkholderia sp. Bp8963 TaxID=2184547 RepID=UPI000F5AECB8|nr:hypothetical protein [Burkholderia sp. Bp8963]RQS64366.1 hypothetical protein DID96_28450 [Burkholderia sp. Bp8963]